MIHSISRDGLRALLLIAAAALLAACSTVRTAYDNADLLTRLMADSYFGLTREQSAAYQASFAQLQQWHRYQEMPVLAAAMQSSAERLSRGLTREDVQWAFDGVKLRMRAAGAKTAEAFGPLLATVTPAQVARLEGKFAEADRAFLRDNHLDDPAKAPAAQTARLAKWFEDWIGDLSAEQQGLVRDMVLRNADFERLRFQQRQLRQRAFVAMLREHRSAQALTNELHVFLVDWEAQRTPEYADAVRRYQQDLVGLILEIDRTMTPAQRARAVRRFERYARDFHALAREITTASAGAR